MEMGGASVGQGRVLASLFFNVLVFVAGRNVATHNSILALQTLEELREYEFHFLPALHVDSS